jgi:hypothetical protein
MTLMPSGGITLSIGSHGALNTWGIASIEHPSPRHRPSIFKGRARSRSRVSWPAASAILLPPGGGGFRWGEEHRHRPPHQGGRDGET